MKIEEKPIESLEALTKAVLEINKNFQGQVWWRGQGKFDWHLSPSGGRMDGGYNTNTMPSSDSCKERPLAINTRQIRAMMLHGSSSCNIIACLRGYSIGRNRHFLDAFLR